MADFAEKNAKGIRILKTVELADFAEKNAKRIRILKMEGLAEFAGKNAKRMGILENDSSNDVVRPSDLMPSTICFCYAIPKRKESAKRHCFSNVCENFFIHETMLSAIFQKSSSFRSRSQEEYVKISRMSTELREIFLFYRENLSDFSRVPKE